MRFEHIENSIIFTYKPNKSEVGGFFDKDDGYIYIDSKLGKIDRELVYQHEKQHKRCFKSGCKCYKKDSDFLAEYHAMRFEFDYALKSGKLVQKLYFKFVINDLKKYLKDMDKIKSWKAHYQALRRVCKLKRFKQLAKSLGFWRDINKLL